MADVSKLPKWARAREKGLNPITVYSRIRKGWSIEEALNTPVLAKGKR